MTTLRDTVDYAFCNKIVNAFKSALNQGHTKTAAIEALNIQFRHQSMVAADVQHLYNTFGGDTRYIECGVTTTIQVTGPQVGDFRVFQDPEQNDEYFVQSYRDCGRAGHLWIDEHMEGFKTAEAAVRALPIIRAEVG